MRELRGKTVVITGGAGGIGEALGAEFVRVGARVALLDLDGEGARLVAEHTGAALGVGCDVTDADSVAAAMATVREALGPVDVLINNAGIAHRSLLRQTEFGVIEKVMDVNFFGAVRCTQAVLEELVERGGAVVAISSVAGFAPLVGRCGYSASKHALHGFFDSLRAELDGQVDVLMVCPSYTDTGIDRRALGGTGDTAQSTNKGTVGRLATPQFVAQSVVRALERQKRQIVLSPVGKAAWWMTRLVPRLYVPLMRRSTRDEFQR